MQSAAMPPTRPRPIARLSALRAQVSAAPVASASGASASALAGARLPPEDLLGGAGFTDATGLRDEQDPMRARQPTTRREQLISRLNELGVAGNARELDLEGWTVVKAAMSLQLTARLRARILEVTAEQLEKPRRSGLRFAQLGSLLYHGRVFEEACQCPKQMALAEYMLGPHNGIWQYLCSVRGEGTSGLPVHSDVGVSPGWREPFNVVPEMVTSLFICDEFDQDAGSTFVVPRTHRLCRRPRLQSREDQELIKRDARAVVAKPGDIVMWNGNTWHGSLPRRIPGERVVCSYVNTRVQFRLGEDHSQLPDEVFARNPPHFSIMVGRGSGYSELGESGGLLFGAARNAAITTKLTAEEEATSENDPVKRFLAAKTQS